jgi:PAS domain S-box-containing protein
MTIDRKSDSSHPTPDRHGPALVRTRDEETVLAALAESQRQRRQLEALAEIARAVSGSLRLDEVLRLILRHATALLRTSGASISLLRDDALEVIAGIGAGEAIVGSRLPLVGSMSGRALRSGASIVGDAADDGDAFGPTVIAAGIHNVIIVPMSSARGGAIGVLSVFNRDAPFTSDDADVLHRLADQVAVAVVNARLYEELAEHHALAERHRLVVETSSDAIVITDLDRRIAFANPAAILLFGHGKALIGMPVSRTLPEEMHDVVRRREDLAIEGEPQRYEGTVVRADGEQRIVEVTTAPLREQGTVSGIVASLRDVTDERRARDAVVQSEARYRNLFDTATDAIYTVDLDGTFTSVNEATVRLAGLSRGELLGHSSRRLFDDEELLLVREEFRHCVAGQAVRYECWLLRTDGERRLLSVTNTPIRLGVEVIGVLGVARDVTVERDRAAALERSEARYTRLVESATDAIFTIDEAGRFTAVNRALERGVGRNRAEMIGAPFAGVIDARDIGTAHRLLRDTFSGQRCRGSLRFHAADGAVRHGSVITSPVFEDGRIIGALGIMRDVTDDQRLAEQLLQQEKLAAVGQLVSGVAHELNNPLAAVMAYSELLLTSGLWPEGDTRLAVETIHHEAARAAKIVSGLLTFARQQPAERKDADLNAIVTETVTLRRYALRAAQIELDVDLDPALPRTWADPFQLQQVVLNLLANAEQALAEWIGPRRIAVRTRHDGGRIVVAVSDTGPGVSDDQRDRIFNPFFTTKAVGQGTGLGLSISDGIVRQHGGQIRVESQSGTGASFLIEIPIAEVPPPAALPLPETTATARGRRLLVVDDEPALRDAMRGLLVSLGHGVTTAGGGVEARALLRTNDYDVVLLDLRMSDLGGDALYRELLEGDPRHASRVVFVTGDTQSDQAARFLAEAGRPSVSKPFQLEDLAAVLASVTD